MKSSKSPTSTAAKVCLVFSAAALLATFQAIGAPADVDVEFGTNGSVIFEQTTDTEIWGQLLSLPNGKIVVSGVVGTGSVVARLNDDGSLDTEFGEAGQISVRFGNNSHINSIAITSGGRIVAAGSETYSLNGVQRARFAAAMIRQDGSLDPEFGGTGKVTIEIPGSPNAAASHVLVTPDGKILLSGGGNGKSILVRLTPSGFLDTGFSDDGIAVFDFAYSSNGGVEGNEWIHQSLIQKDGKIVSAGNVSNDVHVFRTHNDGTLDTAFGSQGKLLMSP